MNKLTHIAERCVNKNKYSTISYTEYFNETVVHEFSRDASEKDAIKMYQILKLKRMNHAPIVLKPVDGILQLSIGEEKYDVFISVPEKSFVAFMEEKNLYMVDNEGVEMLIFVDQSIPALCCINIKERNGEVLYPKSRQSVQFKFKDTENIFNEPDYRITEIMLNNDKTSVILNTTDTITFKKAYDEKVEELKGRSNKAICIYQHHKIPVCLTYDGLHIPPAGEFYDMKESLIGTDLHHYEYQKAIGLI